MKYGLVGRNGSGKSTVCQYLMDQGFLYLSLSDMLRQEARLRGLCEERDVLRTLGNELKAADGLDVLAKRAYVKFKNEEKAVFDSIRHPLEASYLKSQGVVLLGVNVDVRVRFERIQQRQSPTDYVDFDTFVQQDQAEESGESFGQSIQETLALCSFVIDNNGTQEALYEKAKQWLG